MLLREIKLINGFVKPMSTLVYSKVKRTFLKKSHFQIRIKLSKKLGGIIMLEKLKRLKYEYSSNAKVGKLPLVCISVGVGAKTAKGFFALGNISVGVFSIGLIAMGGFTLGLVSLGAIALGCIAAGLLATAGISVGAVSIGGIALGIFSLGGVAVGVAAVGGLAVGGKVAFGGLAIAPVAMGIVTKAEVALSFIDVGDALAVQKEQFELLIYEKFPQIWKPFVDWVTMLL